MEFVSFDEKMFWQAIRDKDYMTLKIDTVSAMRQDPTFRSGEAERVLAILKEKVPEIFEERVTLSYEETLAPGAWDKRYFTKLTFWFQENFALDRVAYIKEVGNAVYGAGAASDNGPRPAAASDQNGKADRAGGNFPVGGVILAAAVTLAAVTLAAVGVLLAALGVLLIVLLI